MTKYDMRHYKEGTQGSWEDRGRRNRLLRMCRVNLWASLVAQMVKNPPSVQVTWIWYLGWKDPPEKGMTTDSVILAWRSLMNRGAWWVIVLGVVKIQTWLSNWAQHTSYPIGLARNGERERYSHTLDHV